MNEQYTRPDMLPKKRKQKYTHHPDERRECTQCHVVYERTEGNFSIRSDSHLCFVGYCKECGRKRAAKYRERNPETCKARSLKSATAWFERNKEKARKYRRDRAKRPEIRERRRDQLNHQRKTDPRAAMKVRISGSIREALGRAKGGARSFDILGYSRDDLYKHIEKQFTKGMCWGRFLSGEIHIDHIIPLSSFDFSVNPLEVAKRAWALSNLQPRWWIDNIRKSNKRELLL